MNCKIGFIGAGNMAGAIMKGISKCGYDLYAYDINSEKVAVLAAYGVKSMPSAQALAQSCDFIFLAVKPQNFDQVLPMIKTHINQQAVIVSIAAGITPSYIKAALDYDAKVVQVMPNTPLLLGVGATAMAKAEPTTEQEFDAVADIFGQLGIVCKLALDKMNEIIPVNGSSPAYVYLFAKGFVDYAQTVGIDRDIALKLFCASIKGSAQMMEDSGKSIEELITMVSSPGGTTLQGLDVLAQEDLLGTITRCCEKTVQRAYELSK